MERGLRRIGPGEVAVQDRLLVRVSGVPASAAFSPSSCSEALVKTVVATPSPIAPPRDLEHVDQPAGEA